MQGIKRIQLTLFLEQGQAAQIEEVRRQFNPVQFGLISAHVTLCREDELTNLEKIRQNLPGAGRLLPVTIDFGKVIRFSEGKGVMLPGYGENRDFHELRNDILRGAVSNVRLHHPHMTLIHPRNGTCDDSVFNEIVSLPLPDRAVFNKISLIGEREDGQWIPLPVHTADSR